VFLHDAALIIQNERSRKRGDATVLNANFVRGHANGIVDSIFRDEFFYFSNVVVIDVKPDDLKMIAIFFLELDQIGNLGAAWTTPGRPKIQKHHFAARPRERERLSIEIIHFEIRSLVGIADEPNDRTGIRRSGRSLLSRDRRRKAND